MPQYHRLLDEPLGLLAGHCDAVLSETQQGLLDRLEGAHEHYVVGLVYGAVMWDGQVIDVVKDVQSAQDVGDVRGKYRWCNGDPHW